MEGYKIKSYFCPIVNVCSCQSVPQFLILILLLWVLFLITDVICCLKLCCTIWSTRTVIGGPFAVFLLFISHLHYEHSIFSHLKTAGNKFLPNVGVYLPTYEYMASHSRRLILARECALSSLLTKVPIYMFPF
jgi:hypothetical protein